MDKSASQYEIALVRLKAFELFAGWGSQAHEFSRALELPFLAK